MAGARRRAGERSRQLPQRIAESVLLAVARMREASGRPASPPDPGGRGGRVQSAARVSSLRETGREKHSLSGGGASLPPSTGCSHFSCPTTSTETQLNPCATRTARRRASRTRTTWRGQVARLIQSTPRTTHASYPRALRRLTSASAGAATTAPARTLFQLPSVLMAGCRMRTSPLAAPPRFSRTY
jgi:hypothetical protein